MCRAKIEFAALSMPRHASKSPSRTVINSGPKIISERRERSSLSTRSFRYFPVLRSCIIYLAISTFFFFSPLFLLNYHFDRIEVNSSRKLKNRVYIDKFRYEQSSFRYYFSDIKSNYIKLLCSYFCRIITLVAMIAAKPMIRKMDTASI